MSSSLLDLCFNGAKGFVEFSFGGLSKAHHRWLQIGTIFSVVGSHTPKEHYFGPAVRIERGIAGKRNCKGSWVCWVDIDNEDPPYPILPPSAVIWSGHGWHLYWRLTEFCEDAKQLEDANKALAHTVKGDSAHNIDRLLRLPGTINTRRGEPYRECKLVLLEAFRTYSIQTLQSLALLDEKILRKIQTGDRRGYPSRSERDLAIVRALVNANFSTSIIQLVFENCACGDKYRDPKTRGEEYLTRTIATARGGARGEGTPGASGGVKGRLVEIHNCYYVAGYKGQRQLSTFTFTPTMLLEGDEDSIVGDIRASCTEYIWRDVVIPQSAFRSLGALNRRLTKMAWTWLGKDSDVRALQAHLMDQLQDAGIPRARAVNSIGRHHLSDDPRVYFACNTHTLASDGSIWAGALNNPLLYVPTGREAPELELQIDAQPPLESIAALLPQLNRPECIWPMIGWHAAAPMKSALEQLGYRFPILNVTGTRGSGKTTLLVHVFQNLLGYKIPRSYNSNTTHFVTLSLLGSTNSIPIAFSEFRAAMSEDFLRYILLAYDTGRDARGRSDQTTVEYPLIAPFTLDGEDRVDDPAALERIVSVVLSPRTIDEGTPCWQTYQQLQQLPLKLFACPYLQFTLSTKVPELLKQAEREFNQAFSMILPTRIRRNVTICWLGILALQQFFAQQQPSLALEEVEPSILTETLENVYSVSLGRAPTAADSFVEVTANAAARKLDAFPWELDSGVLWFQLTPAFEYFRRHRALRRQTTLSRDAVRIQLRELTTDYTLMPEVRVVKGRKVLVYGVDLVKAYKAGLDVPESVVTRQFVVDF